MPCYDEDYNTIGSIIGVSSFTGVGSVSGIGSVTSVDSSFPAGFTPGTFGVSLDGGADIFAGTGAYVQTKR